MTGIVLLSQDLNVKNKIQRLYSGDELIVYLTQLRGRIGIFEHLMFCEFFSITENLKSLIMQPLRFPILTQEESQSNSSCNL